jgi:hypothetical protein
MKNFKTIFILASGAVALLAFSPSTCLCYPKVYFYSLGIMNYCFCLIMKCSVGRVPSDSREEPKRPGEKPRRTIRIRKDMIFVSKDKNLVGICGIQIGKRFYAIADRVTPYMLSKAFPFAHDRKTFRICRLSGDFF